MKLYQGTEIDEAAMTDHVAFDRFERRFLNLSPKPVGFENRQQSQNNRIGYSEVEYTKVGTRSIRQDEINEIKRRMDILRNYKFPLNKSYAVKLYDFMITPDTVDFDSEESKQISKNKTLIFLDEETYSHGNVVYIIIRNNMGITIFFAKGYMPIDASKFKVDTIVKDFDKILQKKIY